MANINATEQVSDGLHHVGVSVRNMDASIHFYCDLLGWKLLRRCGFGSSEMDRITNLRGARGEVAMIQMGRGCLELFQFTEPGAKGNPSSRQVSDHGISHFSVSVRNLREVFKRLVSCGVEFHCEPQQFGDTLATYLRDPDGNVVELLEPGALQG